jgi:hypothetical protein
MKVKKRRAPALHPTENQIQIALMEWAELGKKTKPELALLFHIPNGAYKSKAASGLFKLLGQKAGVPDLFLPVARSGFHGFWIELKSKRGTVRAEQKHWLAELQAQGYAVEVCRDWKKAADLIMDYLRGDYAKRNSS